MVDVSNLARVKWHGKWIWGNDVTPRRRSFGARPAEYVGGLEPNERNVYMLLRKTFKLKDQLSKAMIYISADSRYKLFVNGKYVGRGINRCEAYYWYYNTYDLTSLLKPGENVIAIHARYYGVPFAYYTPPELVGRNKADSGKGAVIFDLELDYGVEKEWIISDETCKIIRNSGENSIMPLKNDALGFIEDFDSRKVPRNWNELGFDDSKWEKPEIFNYPIKTLIIDENAPLHEELQYPSEIIEVGESDNVEFDEDLDEEDFEEMDFCIQSMMEGNPEPLESFEVKNIEHLTNPQAGNYCEIIPKEGAEKKTFSLFLKFGREMVGYPQILVEAGEGTKLDIIPSEKRNDNLPGLDLLGQKRGSRVILRGGKQFFEQWDWEGYLYMMIKIRTMSEPVKIFSLATNVTHMRISQKGQFTSNNPKLDELWDACAHTVLCCGTDAYLDCPSREQRPYLGDAYPEALIANACFGEPRLTKKLIYDTAYGQRKDGITFSFHPGDAQIQCHIIPDYCFYWIQITQDYYQYYGDDQVLEDMYPHFIRAIDWFWKYIDPQSGLLDDVPYWLFIDWSFSHDKPGKWAILNTQFMDVLYFVADLAEKFNDLQNAKRFRTHANKLKLVIDSTFWDAKEGCYRDYLHEGKLHQISHMTNSYLALKGIASDAKVQQIFSRVFEFSGADENDKQQIDQFYTKNQSHHAFGDQLKEKVTVAQPFFMHQVNKFFDKYNRHDLLYKYLLKWIPMLEIGQTKTIWETWSIAGSECHAWAATPAYDLSTYWLGVRPIEPGFEEVEIAPTFYGLDKVNGFFPTCKGKIQVKWEKSLQQEKTIVNLEVILPDEITQGALKIRPIIDKLCSEIETDSELLSEKGKIYRYSLSNGKNQFIIHY